MATKSDKLAIDGGQPVFPPDKTWPRWPAVSEEKWRNRVAPALKAVYLSACESLPNPVGNAFAQRFAEFCGAAHGQMVTSGTTAIGAALAGALDLYPWDEGGEVILPNYTFVATASAALDRRCGLAFVDIDPVTFTMDPDAVEAAVQPGRTRAILAVHILGHPCDMARINAIAAKHGLKVIEDCAQAHGAATPAGRVGSLGDVGAFSFQSSKNLTCGEGGVVTTSDEDIAARVTAFMDVGRTREGYRWDYARLGWNYRPSEYLAALLNLRLDELEGQIARRTRNAEVLTKHLADVPGVTPARWGDWCRCHAYHLYPILIDPAAFGGKTRDEVSRALAAEGVGAWAGYRTPLSDSDAVRHQWKNYPGSVRVAECPNTRDVCARSLWFGQSMLLAEEEDMVDLAAAVAKVQRAYGSSKREQGETKSS